MSSVINFCNFAQLYENPLTNFNQTWNEMMYARAFTIDPLWFYLVKQDGHQRPFNFPIVQQVAVDTQSYPWNPIGKHILAFIFALTEPTVTQLGRNNNRDSFNIW